MTAASGKTILTGAHVIDPAQGIDRVVDVVMRGTKIESIGDSDHSDADAIVDFSNHYLSPG